MKKIGIFLLLGLGLARASKDPPPDIKLWNDAVQELHTFGDLQLTFAQAAHDWALAKQAELNQPGTVNAQALKKFTAMWIAWQGMQGEFRKVERSFHEFYVVEGNQ
ncbi:MAG: hypothetical protein KGI27_10095 [Thaumarchaeota archaeon]|nr:hypothetical protein [Nitrososphaerota archaeon]